MIIEHFLYADGQTSKLKPVSDELPTSKIFDLVVLNKFEHEFYLVTDKQWPYRFMIETELVKYESDDAYEVSYKAYTWFIKLSDLLEYRATRLKPDVYKTQEVI